MKRAILIVIIVGMFSWAIYDFVIKSDSKIEETKTEEMETTDKVEVDTKKEDKNGKDKQEKAADTSEASKNKSGDDVGLNIGQYAPDFELTTVDGEVMRLSDFRGEKVMVNFWATWCPPCRAEMPDMQKFHEDTDVVIFSVNLIDTENARSNVPNFIEDFGLTFPVLLDENSTVATVYQIKPIPTTYLVDSTGRIHNKAFGAINYEQMVQEYEKMQ